MRTRHLMSAVTGASLLVAGAAIPATAHDSRRTHTVEFHMDMTPFTPVGTNCDTTGNCIVVGNQNGTVTGDMDGSLLGSAGLWIANGAHTAGVTLVFTGTIHGCGSGTVAMRGLFGSSDLQHVTGTLEFVPGLGAGDIANVTGTGRLTADAAAGTAAATARIRCPSAPD